MPMTKDGMMGLIKSKYEAKTGKQFVQTDEIEALADAIVSYIQQNAQVQVEVTSVAGVQPGGGTSGPGAGTGKIA